MEKISELLAPVLKKITGPPVQDLTPEAVVGDSVLEERFWDQMKETRKGMAGAVDQFQIGKYRVDAIVDCDGLAIVVELDGKAFHDYMTDRLRDQEILKSVDAVIRIPFAALWNAPNAVFHVLARWYPRFTIDKQNPRKVYKEVMSKDEYQQRSDATIYSGESFDEAGEVEIYSTYGDVKQAWVGNGKHFYGNESPNGPPIVSVRQGSARPRMVEDIHREIDQRERRTSCG